MAQRILLKRVVSTQSRSFCTKRINPSSISSLQCNNIINTSNHNVMHTHSNMNFNMNVNKFLDSSQKRFNSFQSTRTLLEESKEDKAPAAPEADEVPEFQNPLHHNDPNSEKIMIEDYPEGEAPIVPLPPFDDGSGNVVAPPHLHALADEIVGLTMLEVKELVDRVADHFGIEEGEDDFAGGDGADVAEAEVVEVKTTFDLKLTGFDAKSKIKVIKEIRAITGLGLKEAKELVEGAPKTVSKDIKMEEAEKLKAKLEAVGATVEIE